MRDDKLVNNYPDLTKDDSYALLKSLNSVIFKILENCDKTIVFSILLRFLRVELLSEESNPPASSSSSQPSFIDFVTRCLLKLAKALKSFINEIDLAAILKDIHLFFSVHPSSTTKSPSSSAVIKTTQQQARNSLPMKTVKTILHEIVKLKGEEINKYLTLVPPSTPPPLIVSYIHLMLKSTGGAGSSEDAAEPQEQTEQPKPQPQPAQVQPSPQPAKAPTQLSQPTIVAQSTQPVVQPVATTKGTEAKAIVNNSENITSSTLNSMLNTSLSVSSGPVDAAAVLERLRSLRDKCGFNASATASSSSASLSSSLASTTASTTTSGRVLTIEELREKLRAATQKGAG